MDIQTRLMRKFVQLNSSKLFIWGRHLMAHSLTETLHHSSKNNIEIEITCQWFVAKLNKIKPLSLAFACVVYNERLFFDDLRKLLLINRAKRQAHIKCPWLFSSHQIMFAFTSFTRKKKNKKIIKQFLWAPRADMFDFIQYNSA